MENLYPVRLLKDHAYAIVDFDSTDDIAQDWPLIPLVPQTLRNEKHLLPSLLCLNEMQPDQRTHLLDMLDHAHRDEERAPVATFLSSEADAERMRLHWIRQMVVSLPQQKKALLRSYDPRVFVQLQWMCTDKQLKTLFGPIARWTIYLDGRWHTTTVPEAETLQALSFKAEQAGLLERIEPINEVLYMLPQEEREDREATSRAINALLVRARNHGLTTDSDRIQFALQGMRIHPAFDTHPAIVDLLKNLDPAEQTYADAAALLDEATWARIASDMSASTEKRTT